MPNSALSYVIEAIDPVRQIPVETEKELTAGFDQLQGGSLADILLGGARMAGSPIAGMEQALFTNPMSQVLGSAGADNPRGLAELMALAGIISPLGGGAAATSKLSRMFPFMRGGRREEILTELQTAQGPKRKALQDELAELDFGQNQSKGEALETLKQFGFQKPE